MLPETVLYKKKVSCYYSSPAPTLLEGHLYRYSNTECLSSDGRSQSEGVCGKGVSMENSLLELWGCWSSAWAEYSLIQRDCILQKQRENRAPAGQPRCLDVWMSHGLSACLNQRNVVRPNEGGEQNSNTEGQSESTNVVESGGDLCWDRPLVQCLGWI